VMMAQESKHSLVLLPTCRRVHFTQTSQEQLPLWRLFPPRFLLHCIPDILMEEKQNRSNDDYMIYIVVSST